MKNNSDNIWRLAWPLILSNISVPLLGTVDTAILGHLDSAVYLGAVAVGSSILTFLFWAFGFLRMGTTSLVARAYGRDDLSASVLLLLQSCVLACALALLLLLLQPILFSTALVLISASDEVAQLAQSYCSIRIYSAPATLMNFALIGWFIGQQNTKAPLVIVVSQNLLNILLDVLFILVMGMNSDGAALATVIAEYFGLALGITLVLISIRRQQPQVQLHKLCQPSSYYELFQVNRHLFVRTASLLFTFAFFTAQGARQSDSVLAANAILFQLLLLTSYGLDGFAHAAEALIGKAIGGRDSRSFIAACKGTTVWALITALGFTVFFIVMQNTLLSLFTDIEDISAIAQSHYIWIIALPLIGVWSYQLDGIFIGAGKTSAMQNAMLLSVFTVFLPFWWLFQDFGNAGLWLAFSCFMFSRGVFLAAVFIFYQRRGAWFA